MYGIRKTDHTNLLRGLRQPFKDVFDEVYALSQREVTPARGHGYRANQRDWTELIPERFRLV